MKKMTLGKKLITSFSTVAIITVAVGIVGYYGAVQSDKTVNQLGKESLPSVDNLQIIKSEAETIKSLVRALAIPGLSAEMRKSLYEGLPKSRESYQAAWKVFETLPQAPNEAALWKELVPAWNAWRAENNKVIELCKQLDQKGIPDAAALAFKIEQSTKDHYLGANKVMQLLQSKEATFEGGADHNACNCGKWLSTFKTENQSLAAQVLALAGPHQQFHQTVGRIKDLVAEGKSGEAQAAFQTEMVPTMQAVFKNFEALRVTVNDAHALQVQIQQEVLGVVVERQTAAIALLDKLVQSHRDGASGEVKAAAAKTAFLKTFCLASMIMGVVVAMTLGIFIGRSITKLVRQIASNLALGSDQVASAASQVSATSQSLAEGASEQAASLEETSASLEEISSMTQRNAQNVQSAKDFTAQTRATAESGAQSTHAMGQAMNGIRTASGEMRDAMNGIKAASNDVAKIIKTIDEIAFQTNILALNAAVEAARAGEAGMGFAVVADEVRNLAQRSAKAAKETADMIETSIKRSDDGVRVTDKVVTSVEEVAAKSQQLEAKLAEIVAKAQKVDEQVAQIASASNEQSQGISEVNMAVSQMDKVTQGNASNAEESAAAAEELNAQAEVLKEAVRELQQLVGGEVTAPTPQPKAKAPATFRPNSSSFKSPPKSGGPPKPAPKSASVPNDLDFPMPEPIGAGSAKSGFKDF